MSDAITKQSEARYDEARKLQELSEYQLINSPALLADLARHAQADYLARSHLQSDSEARLLDLVRECLPLQQTISREFSLFAEGTSITIAFNRNLISPFTPADTEKLIELLGVLQRAGIYTLTFSRGVSKTSVYRTLRILLADPSNVSVTSSDSNSKLVPSVFQGNFGDALAFLLSATFEDAL